MTDILDKEAMEALQYLAENYSLKEIQEAWKIMEQENLSRMGLQND